MLHSTRPTGTYSNDSITDAVMRRFASGAATALVVLSLPFALMWLAGGDVMMAGTVTASVLVGMLARIALKHGASAARVAWTLSWTLTLMLAAATWRSGGLGSLASCWFLILPLVGTYMFGPRGCLTLSLLATGTVAALWSLQTLSGPPPVHLSPSWIPVMNSAHLIGIVLACTMLTVYWKRSADYEQDLRAEIEQEFSRVIAGMNDAVLVLDAEGGVHSGNRAAHALLDNLPRGERRLLNWLEDAAGRPVPDGLRDGESLALIHPGDGRHFDAAISHGAGRVIVALHDVSERAATEAHLREASEAALAANRAKSEFLANMSHEIRTPMNGILGMAEVALQDNPDDVLADRLYTIRRCGQSMMSLLNDVLDLSRIEAGHMELEHAEFDPHAELDAVHETFAGTATLAGLDLHCHAASDVPAAVLGDAQRLRQVLLNLVGNALKFTEDGMVRLGVELLEEGGGTARLRFRVQDTGVGIDADELPTLFDKFTQGRAGAKRNGTGLGLTISRELVERMGGKIEVRSEPGTGSSFHFDIEFPLAQSGLEEDVASALVGRRILLIDGEEQRLRAMSRLVRRLGGRYEICPAAGEALARLRHAAGSRDPYWAVVLGHPAPGMASRAFLRTLHGDSAVAGTPVLIHASGDDAEALSKLGAAGVLRRPVEFADLQRALLTQVEATTPEDRSPGEKGHAGPTLDTGSTPRVLLVEDNEINRKVVLALLERAGYTAESATDGRQAVLAARRGGYHLILMDCQMPVMDGYQATRAIRALEGEASQVPIVALTAHAMPGDRERCLDAGMDDYLSKPLRAEALAEVLERWSPSAGR